MKRFVFASVYYQPFDKYSASDRKRIDFSQVLSHFIKALKFSLNVLMKSKFEAPHKDAIVLTCHSMFNLFELHI